MLDAQSRLRLLLAVVCIFVLPLSAQQQPQQVPGAIRSQITMVPVDIRVLDRNGRPVTDLTQADFIVTENGIRQKIVHFTAQGLVPEASPDVEAPALRRIDADVKPQNRRVFLFVMGRGRMNGPVKEIEALDEFVRRSLLPQDLVAMLAYNRATDFTRNHRHFAEIIGRYKARHQKIEALLNQYFSGLRAVYGSRQIPAHIQKEIDAIFDGDADLRARQVTGEIADRKRIAEDVKRTADELMRAELNAARPPEAPRLSDIAADETANALDISFDEYVEKQTEQMQDLGNLYAGIEYLRRVEGEKHITFVTPRGLLLPRSESDRSLASLASDARVVLDIIHTGGVVGAPPVRISSMPGAGMRMTASPLPTTAAVFGQTFNIQSLRRIADMTGGQMTAFRSGRDAFAKIDDSTRFQYLLGYYPKDTNWNGAFRNIKVEVNRPGVTVHYRRGYFASAALVPVDRREFLTFTRMSAAGRYTGELKDILVTLEAPVVVEAGAVLEVRGRLDASRVKFASENGQQVASLDIGIFAGDEKQQVIGETMKRIELRLTPEQHATLMKQGAPLNSRIAISGVPRFVKVVVYDYAADLVGTAVATLPKK
jgi:VWFA-related protein